MSRPVLIIDANCLMQIVPRRSRYRWILDYYHTGRFYWAYSTDILLEYEEVFSRWTSPSIVRNVINDIQKRSYGIEISPTYFWHLIDEDEDDNKYIDCAIAANADCVVSNDRHFRILDTTEFPRLNRIEITDVQPAMFGG